LGSTNAGKPGFAPYPTVYDDVISDRGMHSFCVKHGLFIEDQFGVGTFALRGRAPFRIAILIFARLVRLLTLGRAHDRYIDLTFMIRKPAVMSPERLR
jgi:hypothetical protein